MKKALLLSLVMILGFAFVTVAEDGDDILGIWMTEKSENGQAKVEILKENDEFFGKIIWLEKPTYPTDDAKGMGGQVKIDRENPDPELRERPIIGLNIVEGFQYAGNNLWKGGTIYDPANGKTYKCKIRLAEDGTLKVRGYVGFSFLGRTTEWTRPTSEQSNAADN